MEDSNLHRRSVCHGVTGAPPNPFLLYFHYCLWSAFVSFRAPPHQHPAPPGPARCRPEDNSISAELWAMKPAQPNASQMLSEGFLAVNFPWLAPTPFLFLLLDHPLLNSLVPPPSSAGQPRAHLETISRKQDVQKGGASLLPP